MNVFGSSPAGSIATLTWKPSATSSSDDRAAAPWPAASGSKLRTTFVAKRFNSWPGRRQRGPGRGDHICDPSLIRLGEIKIPFHHDGMLGSAIAALLRWRPYSVRPFDVNRRLRANSDTSAAGRLPSPGRRMRRSPRCRDRSGSSAGCGIDPTAVSLVALRRPARSGAATAARTPPSADAPSALARSTGRIRRQSVRSSAASSRDPASCRRADGASRCRELLAEPRRGDFVHLQQRLALALRVARPPWNPPARAPVRPKRAGELSDRVGERRPCRSSSTNLMTSPPTPHPKQWKKPFSPLTWNDGVFSPWNGQSPFHATPLRRSGTRSWTTCTMSACDFRSSMKDAGKERSDHAPSTSTTTVTPPPPWFVRSAARSARRTDAAAGISRSRGAAGRCRSRE